VTFHTLSIYTHTNTKTGLDSVVLKVCKKIKIKPIKKMGNVKKNEYEEFRCKSL